MCGSCCSRQACQGQCRRPDNDDDDDCDDHDVVEDHMDDDYDDHAVYDDHNDHDHDEHGRLNETPALWRWCSLASAGKA